MKISLAESVRKLADLIVIEIEDLSSTKKENPEIKVHEEPIKKTHKDNIKRPRELPHFKKKWSPENKTEEMKKYMQEYRADGRDRVTNSPNSKYVKKPKV